MTKVSVQGDADGLCGMYCLINFMRHYELGERTARDHDRAAFKYLLRAAQRLNILTPDRLIDGFERWELKDIFNLVAYDLGEAERAYTFVELSQLLNTDDYNLILSHVFDHDGVAVVSTQNGGHWVLATALGAATVIVTDPGFSKPGRKLRWEKVDQNLDAIGIFAPKLPR